MKVLVLGATGRTGQIVVRRLLERSDAVTAFARNPADLAAWGDRVRVAQGEARPSGRREFDAHRTPG